MVEVLLPTFKLILTSHIDMTRLSYLTWSVCWSVDRKSSSPWYDQQWGDRYSSSWSVDSGRLGIRLERRGTGSKTRLTLWLDWRRLGLYPSNRLWSTARKATLRYSVYWIRLWASRVHSRLYFHPIFITFNIY